MGQCQQQAQFAEEQDAVASLGERELEDAHRRDLGSVRPLPDDLDGPAYHAQDQGEEGHEDRQSVLGREVQVDRVRMHQVLELCRIAEPGVD
jgi:hypothetical protein